MFRTFIVSLLTLAAAPLAFGYDRTATDTDVYELYDLGDIELIEVYGTGDTGTPDTTSDSTIDCTAFYNGLADEVNRQHGECVANVGQARDVQAAIDACWETFSNQVDAIEAIYRECVES